MAENPLRTALAKRQLIMAPGLQDMTSAIVANRVGFDFVYASGCWLTASTYGLPDAGLVSYTQMVERVGQLCDTSDAKVIADADTGFGGLINIRQAVKGYERAGAVALQLEDQEFPKRCGHAPGKRVVEVAEMVDRVKVACDSRDTIMVIARTDARQPEGFEAALDRAHAYAQAGADMVFVEALQSEDEMIRACQAIDAPMMVNMANGGLSPLLPASRLSEIGYALAIYPSLAPLAAAAAVEASLQHLKANGTCTPPDIELFDFDDFSTLIGFAEVRKFEEKWARTHD